MTTVSEPDRWDRRHLLRTLILIAVIGVLLLTGLGYATYLALSGPATTGLAAADPETNPVAEPLPGSGQQRRDMIATTAMLAVSPQAGRSGIPAATAAPAIEIPAAGQVGPAQVPTGYPRTPHGAVGQWAAIATSVLQTMSIEHTHQVHQAWSQPGAAPVQTWELMDNVRAFLASASGPYAEAATTTVVLTPKAAQVKGVDGEDWTLACVLFEVQVTVATRASVAYGACAPMQWSGTGDSGRWLIGAGAPAARAPSTWPGTDLAAEAGWLTWVPAEAQGSTP